MSGLSIGAVLLTVVFASLLNCTYARFSPIRYLADPTDDEALVDVIRVKLLKNAITGETKPTAQRSEMQVEEIRFGFDPTDPTRERKGPSVYMGLRGNGEATVFIFERNEQAVTGVYKGTLTRKLKARLTARIQRAIEEAKGAATDPNIIRESDLFFMSVKYKSGVTASVAGKVEDMPPYTRALVNGLRTLWMRFSKFPPAAGYVRSEAIGKERLSLLLKEGRLRFARVEDFSPELQSLLRGVIHKPADFHPVSMPQLEQLRSRASFGELFLTDGDSGYKISFLLPKQGPPDAEKSPPDEQITPYEKRGTPRRPHRPRDMAQPVTAAGDVVFTFHPRWRDEPADDLSLTLRPDGSALCVFYDADSSTITGAYKGRLSAADAARFISRVEGAFEEMGRAGPRDDGGRVTEGDLFYLSIRLRDGTVKQMGRKVGDAPEGVRGLVDDLSVLWKRFKKSAPADAYLWSRPVATERLQELRQRGGVRIANLDEYPANVRQIILAALNRPFALHALTRAQFEGLSRLTALIMHDGSGYELYLLKSRSYPPKR